MNESRRVLLQPGPLQRLPALALELQGELISPCEDGVGITQARAVPILQMWKLRPREPESKKP